MKTLKITAVEPGPEVERTSPTQQVTINIYGDKGSIRHVQLTNTHVLIRRRDICVGIPISDLIKNCEVIEPNLISPVLKIEEQPPVTAI